MTQIKKDTADHIKTAIRAVADARESAPNQAGEALIKAATWLEAALVHSPAPTGPDPKNDPPPPLNKEKSK